MHISSRLLKTSAAVLGALALAAQAAPVSATTILFIGNSYTYGEPAGAAPIVQNYQPGTVNDLNHSGIGGVPALFKAMTVEAGLHYDVSLETVPGVGVDYHYNNKLNTVLGSYDKVLLQSYSTLDASKPGDPSTLIKYSGLLAQAFHDINPNVDVMLTSTWSRADLTYKTNSPWLGKPIEQMALDVRNGYNAADAASNLINGVIPVGQAWNRAIDGGLADANPYDGIGAGQIDLWAPENYHASPYGYYLEALTIFGSVTGLDPALLGAGDSVARDLGIDSSTAAALQGYASAQLASEQVPEPNMALMFLTVGGLMVVARRRKQSQR
ncbi:PEP-CTERM sorting domain-containing protein [Massilia sp. 9096]|uniref:PEP-CTERM sorting domain-containing protein n=1 Tax=Massilia sp. 9096 TaxID=1500894 RepID=UPI00068DA76B|nr:PEP-CTERM sorting domain-containing protein [Massilia sp. 9096]